MRSSAADRALQDILYHIDLACSFTVDFDDKTFKLDVKTVYAVTRCLEIISEASRRLPSDLKERHPEMPWTQMASAGNVYRHDYEDVAAELVWVTVQNALPLLRIVVTGELQGAR